jgi:hypothetical protein
MLQSVSRIDYMGPMIISTVRSGLINPVMAGPDRVVTAMATWKNPGMTVGMTRRSDWLADPAASAGHTE